MITSLCLIAAATTMLGIIVAIQSRKIQRMEKLWIMMLDSIMKEDLDVN